MLWTTFVVRCCGGHTHGFSGRKTVTVITAKLVSEGVAESSRLSVVEEEATSCCLEREEIPKAD